MMMTMMTITMSKMKVDLDTEVAVDNVEADEQSVHL